MYEMKIFFVLVFVTTCFGQEAYNKNYFPSDFLFGVSSSAYQIEGAWNADGKGENIWDRLVHTTPELIYDNSSGDISSDGYHKYKEDVQLLKQLNVSFYRFSISWSRLLPSGFINKVNEAGKQYYLNLISELRANDIEPFITLYHWDLPQPLQELGGWTNPLVVNWFADFAKKCFELFGSYVTYWATFNEPRNTCQQGYGEGGKAPEISSPSVGEYLCGHYVLKAHAEAWHIYDSQFRGSQKGQIGIVLDTPWCEAETNNTEDITAAEVTLEFSFGWYANPIVHGDYPAVMKERMARRSKDYGFSSSLLPEFSFEEIIRIKGTYDFFGVNVYTAALVRAGNTSTSTMGFFSDVEAILYQPSDWLGNGNFKITPWSVRKLLKWIKTNYSNPQIYITENGYVDDQLEDDDRIAYLKSYLSNIRDAMEEDCVNVLGYSVWSFLDSFEWYSGYRDKFGLFAVNFTDPDRPRTARKSAGFYKNLTSTKCIVDNCSNGNATCHLDSPSSSTTLYFHGNLYLFFFIFYSLVKFSNFS